MWISRSSHCRPHSSHPQVALLLLLLRTNTTCRLRNERPLGTDEWPRNEANFTALLRVNPSTVSICPTSTNLRSGASHLGFPRFAAIIGRPVPFRADSIYFLPGPGKIRTPNEVNRVNCLNVAIWAFSSGKCAMEAFRTVFIGKWGK